MTTNKELVRQLAEKMAKARYNLLWAGMSEANKNISIAFFEKLAEEVVIEFGAKMFEEGYMCHCEEHTEEGINAFQGDVYYEAFKRGLIAEKEVEDEG